MRTSEMRRTCLLPRRVFDCAVVAWMLYHVPDVDRGSASSRGCCGPEVVPSWLRTTSTIWRSCAPATDRPNPEWAFSGDNGRSCSRTISRRSTSTTRLERSFSRPRSGRELHPVVDHAHGGRRDLATGVRAALVVLGGTRRSSSPEGERSSRSCRRACAALGDEAQDFGFARRELGQGVRPGGQGRP